MFFEKAYVVKNINEDGQVHIYWPKNDRHQRGMYIQEWKNARQLLNKDE